MAAARDEKIRPLSPVKKNKNGQVIHVKQKIIVVNMYKRLKEDNPQILYEATMTKISKMTGIGTRSVKKIIAEYSRTGQVVEPDLKKRRLSVGDKIDEFDKNAIRRKIHNFYLNQERPTVEKVLNAVNDDKALPDFKRSTFYKVLVELNFSFTKRQCNSALTEREDLIVWRRKYLRTIKRYRVEGRSIYYLDETWVNGEGQCLIVLHIGSAAGFVPGGLLCIESDNNTVDYYDEVNGDTFLEWFKKVLPSLDENCVIVMDNAQYHSVKQEKIPNTSWRKAAIIEWLQSKGKEIDDTMVKAELLHIVGLEKEKFNKYVIDEVAKEANKTVLRLPPYHCELNPIEMAWSMVKEYVKTNNTTFKLPDLKRLLEEAVARVTGQHWNDFVNQTMKEEKKFWEIDEIADRMADPIPPLLINVKTETYSSTDDSD